MTTAGGIGMLKFINYGIFILIIMGIIAGVINGVIEYKKTGDKKMLIDKTLGEVVLWDTKIYVSMSQLLDPEFLSTVPEEIRSDYVSGLAKTILMHLFLFCVILYVLFRIGNWIVGLSQFSPVTDIAIIIISVLIVFILFPLVYGYAMGVDITLFRGIGTFFSNFVVWWNAMGGIAIEGVTSTATVESGLSVINLG